VRDIAWRHERVACFQYGLVADDDFQFYREDKVRLILARVRMAWYIHSGHERSFEEAVRPCGVCTRQT